MAIGERFEQFMPVVTDTKGRVFGYVVGFADDLETGDSYAWVQKSVSTKDGGFKDFGPYQRSRKFKSQSEAKAWAFRTAKERMKR